MRNFKILAVFLFGLLSNRIMAQFGYTIPSVGDPILFIETLCYNEDFVEKVKVAKTINTTNLSIAERLKFKKKTYSQSHYEFIKSSTFPVHNIRYTYHDNIFPKWYQVADKITIDEGGTKSYYTTYNQYLTGGWVGATLTQDQNGQYTSDPRTGENYYWQYHSTKGQLAYNHLASQVISKGYLMKFYFVKPSTQVLQYYMQNGYTVEVTTSYIKVWNSEIRHTWRLDIKEYIVENITNNVIKSTTTTKYKYYVEFGQYLKQKVIISSPQTFSNGECYENITEITFSDYSTCEDVAFRLTSIKEDKQFSIHPNPASEILSVTVPQSENITKLQVINSTGVVINEQILEIKTSFTTIDIKQIPSGIYFLSMKQGSKNESLKFVKL